MTANPKAMEKQGYHKFKGHGPLVDEGWGSFEVFWYDGDASQGIRPDLEWDEAEGWYWWACFPGCLPDGEPSGPFDTSQQAYDDAQEEA